MNFKQDEFQRHGRAQSQQRGNNQKIKSRKKKTESGVNSVFCFIKCSFADNNELLFFTPSLKSPSLSTSVKQTLLLEQFLDYVVL